MLFCALDSNEFNRVSTCESTQKIWIILQTTYEEISLVKESKIELIFQEYKLFKMKL